MSKKTREFYVSIIMRFDEPQMRLEFRIASFVDWSDPLAVSGSVDPLADPVPGASGSSE